METLWNVPRRWLHERPGGLEGRLGLLEVRDRFLRLRLRELLPHCTALPATNLSANSYSRPAARYVHPR
jgi:hypothetical protein